MQHRIWQGIEDSDGIFYVNFVHLLHDLGDLESHSAQRKKNHRK
jgi:hypothetical protein